MFFRIFRFEFLYQLRQPGAWATAAGLGLLTFLAMSIEQVQLGGGGTNLDINANYVILMSALVMSWFALFLAPILVARVVLRDREEGMAELIGVTPVQRSVLYSGRFLGAWLAALLVFTAILPAGFLGTVMPWHPAEDMAPHQLAPWLYAFSVVLGPNLLIAAAFTFAVAAFSRSMLMTYLAVVALMLGSIVAGTASDHIDWGLFAALADPFGIESFIEVTRYWSVAERNTQLPELSGVLLYNRVIWVGIAILLAVAALIHLVRKRETASRGRGKPDSDEAGKSLPTPQRPAPYRATGASFSIRQLVARSKLEFLAVVRSLPFLILVLLGAVNVLGNATFSLDHIWDAPVIPDTPLMLDVIQNSFGLFLIIAIIYYAGELVWREQRSRTEGIIHALPVPGWVFVVSKLVGMLAMILTMLAVAALSAMAFQLVMGHTDLQPGLYATGLLLNEAWQWSLYGALALFLQVVSGNRFLGMLLMVLVFVASMGMNQAGFEHQLWTFAGMPEVQWSVFFGFDFMLESRLWYGLFWTLLTIALLVLAHLLWSRHSGERLLRRVRSAWQGRQPLQVATLAGSLTAAVLAGSWVVYNTTVLNEHETSDQEHARMAEYEERWLEERDRPQPEIREIRGRVDLKPLERAFRSDMRLTLENPHDQALEEIHLTLPDSVDKERIHLDGGEIVEYDSRTDYLRLALDPAMEPGESRDLESVLTYASRGFTNSAELQNLVANGSYLMNSVLTPTVGFEDGRILTDRRERRRQGLDERPRRADLDDEQEHQRTYIAGDAHWIDLDLTVSTAPGQQVIVPGEQVDHWEEDGRPVFHFESETPIQNFFGVLSADMTSKDVEHEGRVFRIFHHPAHARNVDHMMDWSERSMDLFEDIFTPYQWSRFDIVEIPDTMGFAAQALPHTVPFSEGGGFRADVEAAEPLDRLGYVVAHEIGHMWWAHQVTSANVQGAEVLTESLAEYSALLAMEERYGIEQMEDGMKRRLDSYLQGRSGESREEMPLMRSEGQAYLHYDKGGQVMYALRHYLGKERVNAALREVLEEWAFEGPPYPTSRALVEALEDQAENEFERQLIDKFFKQIVLFEFDPQQASASENGDAWDVALELEARKLVDDGHGNTETESMSMPVEIVAYDDEGKVLERGFHELESGIQTLTLEYGEKPDRLAIDPLRLLPNRNLQNNSIDVE